jgi:hypothetical protein
MELKNFITETLKQIINGVEEAQKDVQNNGAYINPTDIVNDNLSSITINDKKIRVSNINFEVEVSTIDESDTTKGVGVYIANFGIGGKQKDNDKAISTNKISFVVPIAFSTIQYDENNTPTPSIYMTGGSQRRNNQY